MKKFILPLSLVLGSVSVSAQVANQALKIENGASVNLRQVPKFNNLSDFTIQFWLNTSTWNSGAPVFSRGTGASEFSARLGEGNDLLFRFGNETFDFSAPELQSGSWNQLTLVVEQGKLSAYLNGTLRKTAVGDFIIPFSGSEMVLGGNGFEGRIDEMRFWDTAVHDEFFLSWRNTLTKHHPQWENLIAYYKFDQDQCENVVDYKFNYHGIFSSGDARREEVKDNPFFKYRISTAYSEFSRWADRQIDKDKYLLSNDLILLVVDADAKGNAAPLYPYNELSLHNAAHAGEFEGRSGVIALNGAGARLNGGKNTFNPTDKYSFSAWIYLDEWTEDAYIFRKESTPDNGFSIRLGDYDDKRRVKIRVNGIEYTFINKLDVGRWIHLGVAASGTEKNRVFQVTVDGTSGYAVNNTQEVNNYTVSGLEDCEAYIGENLKGKMDEISIWHTFKGEGDMRSFMTNGCPIPSDVTKVEASTLFPINSYWKFDIAETPGYDYYSYKHFTNVIRSNYEGYRGFKIRAGVRSFTNWESAMGNASFRENFANQLAEIAREFDGIDLDFEWCYNTSCFENYGKTIQAIREKMPEGKVFTVTPHYVSYAHFPKSIEAVDYFPFQIYGPSKDVFLWSTYLAAFDRFRAGDRYPNDKIVMSYATTTSRGYDPVTDAQMSNMAPIGVRNGLLDGDYQPGVPSVIDGSGYRRYITDYQQTIDRCEFIHDNDLKGIMYWDMGNDVNTSHPYSLVKAASYSLASNVDTLVTKVDMNLPDGIVSAKGEADRKMNIYPNPAKHNINLSLNDELTFKCVKIYNVQGQLLSTRSEINDTALRLDVSDLAQGFYRLVAIASDNKSYTGSFLIQY